VRWSNSADVVYIKLDEMVGGMRMQYVMRMRKINIQMNCINKSAPVSGQVDNIPGSS